MNVDVIADDDTVNIDEKAAGFAISGDTGSDGGVTVTVTVGTTPLTATSAAADPATWSVSVPGNASYIAGMSVDVSVSASKTGFTAASAVPRSLAVDLVAPVLQSATVADSTLTLTYNEGLATGSAPAVSAFTVKVGGTAVALASVNPVAGSGNTVTLTLASAVAADATVTVSYAAPSNNPVRDVAGNSAANLTDRSVEPLPGRFGMQTTYSWPASPAARPFAGDFNGDGDADIGVWQLNGGWYIRYGDGMGSFDNETLYSWAANPNGRLVTGDFNGDGNTDLVSFFESNGTGGEWYIRYGDGMGSFGNQTFYTWTGIDLHAQPFAADFDGDGNADIGVWEPGLDEAGLATEDDWEDWGGGGPGNWNIRYGDGRGGFSGQTLYKWVVGLDAKPFAGDFNGDGLGDIGVWEPDGAWRIRYGDGSGQFGQETSYDWSAHSAVRKHFVGDFNGDGNTDIGIWRTDDGAWYIHYLQVAAASRAVVTLPSPQAQGSIDAATLTAGRAAWREDVSGYFSHAESFTATSSDGGVARVRVTDTLVTILPVAAGMATITVTAANADTSATAQQTVAVTVQADSVPGEPVVDDKLPDQNVVWTSRGTNDAKQGMPIGNGTQSALVWAGSDSDLYLLLGANDFWSENVRLLHPGRIRIRYSGNPFASGQPFRQELKLKEGEIVITAGTAPEITTRIWVDAHAPVIHIESDRTGGTGTYTMTATFQSLRTAERTVVVTTCQDFFEFCAGGPSPLTVRADTTETVGNAVYWYQRNSESYFDELLEHQGFDASRYPDILTGRTYGGRLDGDGFTASGTAITKTGASSGRVAVTLHSEVVDSVSTWKSQLNAFLVPFTTDIETRRTAHRAWWADFWNRSYIFASGDRDATDLTQKYVLTRYRQACTGRTPGMPIRFTGSLFTVGNGSDPDWVLVNTYHAFNQRFVYWGMLPSGDFDLMQPYFDQYANSLHLARDRVFAWWGPETEGAMWPEKINIFGNLIGQAYGWSRMPVQGGLAKSRNEKVPPSPVYNRSTRHLYTGNTEMVAMLLDRYDYSRDADFARRRLLPLAKEVLTFYFTNWEVVGGKLFLDNLYSGEEDWNMDNPTADVSGLRKMLAGLLALPHALTTPEERADWTTKQGQLPAIPIADGKFKTADNLPNSLTINASATGPPWEPRGNTTRESNNQNLYPIFPLRLYGYGQTDLATATKSFNERLGKYPSSGTQSWRHDATHAAYLGLTSQAESFVLGSLGQGTKSGWRFPTFSDGQPDGDPSVERPAIGKIAFQAMLMHPETGDDINLLNAWPNDWDVQFKLHAPKQTVVKGSRAGNHIAYTATPASRASNVTVRGSLTVNERLALRVDAVAGDNVIDSAEKAAGFTISGQTGSVSGATVEVTLGGTVLGSVTSGSDGSWLVAVPANAAYLTGNNLALRVTASKPGYLDAAAVERTVRGDMLELQDILTLNVDVIADDDTVNIDEKAAGFAISGDTGSDGGVTVTVTVGTTPLTATSAAADPATWSVSVPGNASYIAGMSVDVSVSASKTGFTAASAVPRSLAVDLVAPELQSATVADSTLTLTYNEGLATGSAPAVSAFTVKVGGTAVALASVNPVAGSGNTVTLTLASAVAADATVTVSYAAPSNNPVRDVAGNSAANLTDRSVEPLPGRFGMQTTYSWPASPAARPFAGDFNGDGDADIGVWQLNGGWYIRYGDGMGSFDNEQIYLVQLGGQSERAFGHGG